MNLCGGITGITEQDLFLEIPQAAFTLTPRRKQSSSAPIRRNKSTGLIADGPMTPDAGGGGGATAASLRRTPASGSSSSSSHSHRKAFFAATENDGGGGNSKSTHGRKNPSQNNTEAAMLNPVSKDDVKMYRSRQQRYGMRSSSILMKKLESGFNLTWLNGGGKAGKMVNLATNSDKSYLRIRTRSMESRENQNDGSRSHHSVDVKLKIRHIARVGGEKEAGGGPSSDPESEKNGAHKSTSYFVIKMKQSVGEWIKLKFVAESLAERDTVVLAIRSLMDKTQSVSQCDNSRDRRGHSVDNGVHHDKHGSMRSTRMVDQKKMDGGGDPCVDGRQHDKRGSIRSNRIIDQIADTGKKGHGIDFDVAGDHDHENDHSASNLGALVEKKSEANGNSIRRRPTSARIVQGRRRQQPRTSNNISLDEMKDAFLFETIGCNPIGCQSEALAAVQDGELGDFAANQLSGPWCTDDVCTAGLKDFADSMKGIFDINDPSGKGLRQPTEQQRKVAEKYISGFLSDNKAMSELLSVKDIWNIAATKQATMAELKVRRRLQNRARSADGKATRKSSLQKQMTFSGDDGTAANMTFLQTISSFDDINRSGRWKRKVESKTLEMSGQFDSSGFLDKDVGEIPESSSLEFVYYDSDPEDARERTLRRGPRRAMAERANKRQSDANSRRREALDILDSSRTGFGRRWKRFDEEMVYDIIEATKNESLTLLWHPNNRKEKNNLVPTCVKLWVESGVYLVDGTFLLPKLTWLPRQESNLHTRELNVSDENPGSLDLLDVCRVRECNSIDRSIHPFAHVDRSFIIQTQNRRYLFEAQSKQERARIVNGLKLVIARLASLLMLRDLRAVDEFFGGNNSVPGEAPAWAQSETKQNRI